MHVNLKFKFLLNMGREEKNLDCEMSAFDVLTF